MSGPTFIAYITKKIYIQLLSKRLWLSETDVVFKIRTCSVEELIVSTSRWSLALCQAEWSLKEHWCKIDLTDRWSQQGYICLKRSSEDSSSSSCELLLWHRLLFPPPPLPPVQCLKYPVFNIEKLWTKRREEEELQLPVFPTSYKGALWWRRRKRSDQPWPSALALNMTPLWKRKRTQWLVYLLTSSQSSPSFLRFLPSVPSSSSSSSPQSCPSIAGKRSTQSCLSPRPLSFLHPKSIFSPPIPLGSWLAAPPPPPASFLLLPLSQDKTRETFGAWGGGGALRLVIWMSEGVVHKHLDVRSVLM